MRKKCQTLQETETINGDRTETNTQKSVKHENHMHEAVHVYSTY